MDVAHRDDLAGVLRVDDRCPARHRHHVVGQQRPQGEVFDASGVGHHAGLGSPDELVVGQPALVGVKFPPGFQSDRMQATLGVGELHAVTHDERPSLGLGATCALCGHGG